MSICDNILQAILVLLDVKYVLVRMTRIVAIFVFIASNSIINIGGSSTHSDYSNIYNSIYMCL